MYTGIWNTLFYILLFSLCYSFPFVGCISKRDEDYDDTTTNSFTWTRQPFIDSNYCHDVLQTVVWS